MVCGLVTLPFKMGEGQLLDGSERDRIEEKKLSRSGNTPLPARFQGASVTFEPGARTAWHTQTLIVTAGRGSTRGMGGSQRSVGPVMSCGSRPARNTGTEPQPAQL